jgi:hypothetical protein
MGVGQQRWLRMSRALASGHPAATGLCSACVTTLSVTGAGITLIAAGGAQVSLCTSDATVRQLAELEFSLGDGPAVEAHTLGLPVLEMDLLRRPPTRWPAFAGPALDLGMRAIFAFPLRLGAARLGALVLYQAHPGALGHDTYDDTLIAAEVITRSIITRQAGMPEEALMSDLTDDRAFHAEVHQASGIVSVQLGIGVADALVRLRARAFALDRPIVDVAADVVARRMRFFE